MTEQRPVHIVLAVFLLIVVLTAVADAGGTGPSAARETGASSAMAGTWSSATSTVQPGAGPGDGESTGPGTPAIATTAAPTRAIVREESGIDAESGSDTARTAGGGTPRPGPTPATTSPAGNSAKTGGDGTGTATADAVPMPARAAVPPTTPTVTRAPSGPAPFENGAVITVPSVATATAMSTAEAACPSAPVTTRDRIGLAGDGAGVAVETRMPPADEGRSAERDAVSGERGRGSGSPLATTGSPVGTYLAPDSDRSRRGGAGTPSDSRQFAGAGNQAVRGGPHPTVLPTSGRLYAGRQAGEERAATTIRAGKARHDEKRDAPRSQNGEGRRGPPAHPAPAPVAAPVRTGLEPPGPGESGAGRARKGDLPPLPAAMEADSGVPDPLFLCRFLLFLGYRRIRPGNVLDHPVRRDLSAAIAAEPGLDLAGCVAATGANRETLRYHLSLLVVSGKVAEETRNGSVRYFSHDPALTPVHRAVLHYRRNPSLAPLLCQIRDAPGISRLELAARLDLAGPTVTRQVQRLVDEGLVEPRRCGRSQQYWLTPPCAGAFATVEAAGTIQAEPIRAFDRASA